MTFLRQENRETFNLERGDVLMIPAGTTAYLVNSHENEKLQIVELLQPVNTPGHYEVYIHTYVLALIKGEIGLDLI